MSKKKPRFYTTQKSAANSANEIGALVAEYGAQSFGVQFDDKRRPIALHFVMNVPDVGEVPVQLEAQVAGLKKRLGYGKEDQAYRVAWRQLLYYVEMMLEMVENGLKPFHEAFMADVMIPIRGEYRRLGDAYREAEGRLLPPSNQDFVDVEHEVVHDS